MPDTPSTPAGSAARSRGGQPATLADVAAHVGGIVHPSTAEGSIPLSDVTHNSAEAGPGVLFAARPGMRADGHDFAPAAAMAGSPALMVERLVNADVPQVQVESVARALGPAASAVHHHPSTEMVLIGVTGTNGKTTTAFLVEAGLSAAGHATGLIGTVETRIAGRVVPGVRTTPEGSDLQRLLRDMRNHEVSAAAMEVSSHGLALSRVRGTRFAAVGFTNLSHDHLDFHADLESYYQAKATLFTAAYAPTAVVNLDDAAGRRLAAETSLDVCGVSVRGHPQADVTAEDVVSQPDGSRFVARLDERRVDVRVQVPGTFNVDNALMAMALLDAAGIDLEMASAGIAGLAAVPGRMERVDAGQAFEVIVDYAHTPDALARVVEAVRSVTSGRVILVVGCGGDRDTAKRPVMGRVAAAGADMAVLTSDNPRSEDPDAILDAMMAGARDVAGSQVRRESDRRRAIDLAIAEARTGDVVLIAGKGHEPVQELADGTITFDDRHEAREALISGGHGG